ncbi:MAG: Cof-type HAD-IIB family hydrolase [Ardenticatenaceae bacterium]|nr:Cof-type HAD-IIB family hydrolase [Ardenticatenaceae bacterium]
MSFINPNIQCIAVDLDGTLLTSKHTITIGTKNALRRASAAGVPVVIATGKTRASSGQIKQELGLNTPGVYSQGLIIANPDGTLRHEVHLANDLAGEIAAAAEAHHCTFVTYKDTQIFTTRNNPLTSRLVDFDEPYPIEVGSVENLMDHAPFQKFILLDQPERLKSISPLLEQQFTGRATLVMSQIDMLELVPLGTSKGGGLKILLDDLGIGYENTIAFGDSDNDLEMISWAGIGVAMGNAMPRIKEAATYVTATNDEDGIPLALDKYLFK